MMARIGFGVLFASLCVTDLNADWLATGVSLVVGGPTSKDAATDTALFRVALWAVAGLIAVLATSPARRPTP